MTLSRSPLRWLGVLLLVGCYIAAAARIYWKPVSTEQSARDRRIVRLAHWQMQEEHLATFDALASAYEALHPEVDIQPIAVPLRPWLAWLRTQLVGGTVPDLVQLGRGTSDEVLGHFFTPLDPWITQPNPYNVGTPHAGRPWRDTFVDGLTQPPAFNRNMLTTFGVPTIITNVRVFYNRELLQQITGSARPPKDFHSLLTLAAQVDAYAAMHNTELSLFAGSDDHGGQLLNRLTSMHTAGLAARIDRTATFDKGYRTAALGYLRGDWSLREPALLDALRLTRRMSQLLQPGFRQLQREDCIFLFAQSRAVMIMTGSWDYTTLLAQCPFPLGIFELPLPTSDDAEYGRFSPGPLTERGHAPGGAFGLTRASKHPEIAVDFLRFMTSVKGAEMMSRRGLRLPAIAGVDPPSALAPFALREEGAFGGFDLIFRDFGTGALNRIYETSLHLLVGPEGSVENFVTALQQDWPEAARQDLDRLLRTDRHNLRRGDVLAISHEALGDRTRADTLDETLLFLELDALETERVVNRE